ncbi:molybdopterin-dependent oxidoreductase [Halomonas sp. 11-S5]|uniref:molybdopterin-dependent oxidoreductase n=1 Tax=Halomonas sp. 11-S5 TaxID=2994064 RepID=UPI002468B016|nr:molybdopterin-dependent oxidoreductase [Halomonas sp. 11-S5]
MRVPSSFRACLLAGFCCLLAMIAGYAMADDTPSVLTLTEGSESRELTLEQIETPGLHAVEMRHPEGPEGTFSGVWLDDFLASQGLKEAPRVRFTALDGYTTFLTPAQRREKRYLLVTRLDGEPVDEAALGPLMLVVPEDAKAAREGSVPMTRWIWAIREISAR